MTSSILSSFNYIQLVVRIAPHFYVSEALSLNQLCGILFLPEDEPCVIYTVCLLVSLSCFVVSTVSGNYSQVDKIWSITPFVYTWMAVGNTRTLLMTILATIWG